MILVDTSIWIDHLRTGSARLVALLNVGQVLGHPFVTGELALGSLQQRTMILNSLRCLPQLPCATDDEVLHFIEMQSLSGLGIGYVDVHLLAALRLQPGARLWTRDKRLLAAAQQLDLADQALH